MSVVLIILIAIIGVLIFPLNSFAWGAGVHIGVSLSAVSELEPYFKMLVFGNLNEFLYGVLAPDFIVGKGLGSKQKHSHNWDVAFKLLDNAKNEQMEAFAIGYLSHLAADVAVHGLMVKKFERFKGAKHAIVEAVAENLCDVQYKNLARRIIGRYNSHLDDAFKNDVDSVLFSFGLSKLIFKGFVRISTTDYFSRAFLRQNVLTFLCVDTETIKDYLELSKKFCMDVLLHRKNSPVTKLSAISE